MKIKFFNGNFLSIASLYFPCLYIELDICLFCIPWTHFKQSYIVPHSGNSFVAQNIKLTSTSFQIIQGRGTSPIVHWLQLCVCNRDIPRCQPRTETNGILGSWILRNILKNHTIQEHFEQSPAYLDYYAGNLHIRMQNILNFSLFAHVNTFLLIMLNVLI